MSILDCILSNYLKLQLFTTCQNYTFNLATSTVQLLALSIIADICNFYKALHGSWMAKILSLKSHKQRPFFLHLLTD